MNYNVNPKVFTTEKLSSSKQISPKAMSTEQNLQDLSSKIDQAKKVLKNLIGEWNRIVPGPEKKVLQILKNRYEYRVRIPKPPKPRVTKNIIVQCSRESCPVKCRVPKETYDEGKQYYCRCCDTDRRREYGRNYYKKKKVTVAID